MNSQYPIHQITFKAVVIFKNQITHSINNFTFQLPYYTSTRQVGLTQLLKIAAQQNYIPSNCQIFVADYNNCVNAYLGNFPFPNQVQIKYESLKDNTLEISFREIENSETMIDQSTQMKCEDKKQKCKKVRERTIGEAVEFVQIWRQLYDKTDSFGKRIYTLQSAAKKIQISKKTLDDYYNHIQLANQFKFNFEKYKQMKIGILRKFVKVIKEDKESGQNILSCKMSQYILDNDTDKYWINF